MSLRLDELELISKKLTFEPDYTRFRSVCKVWRSAASVRWQLPWLIACGLSSSKFYQFSFETNRFTEIPEFPRPSLLSSFVDNPHVIIRTAHGWLFLLDLLTKSVSLTNPLTDSIINLPNFQFLDYSGNKYNIDHNQFGFGLTSDPGKSLPDCFALIYYSRRIFYCKVGSNVWSEMQHPEVHYRSDLHICCYRGKIFLGLGADVFVCEFGDNPNICKLVSFELNAYEFEWTRLVESDGDLLLVLVYDLYYRSCKVFKLEFGQQQTKLVKLKCLGDRALLVGLDTTFSLTASKYPGCKINSIYIPGFLGRCEDGAVVPALFIHDCEEENCKSIIDEDVPAPAPCIPCFWFRPSLLM